MKIAVVDDDIQVCECLESLLKELLEDAAKIICYTSGESFLASWKPQAFDIVILDIFMDRLTGIDVARQIRKKDDDVKLVFITASNEFASESYEVNACYYLCKPFGKEQLTAMLNRLDLAQIETMRVMKLPNGISVRLRDVLYADYASHCVTLDKKRGRNTTLRISFSKIEEMLCAYPYFLSPTKGIIINLYEVEQQNGDTFKMRDGRLIPISRRKTKGVMDAYSSFIFDQLRKEGEK